jgi:hypothetical protein
MKLKWEAKPNVSALIISVERPHLYGLCPMNLKIFSSKDALYTPSNITLSQLTNEEDSSSTFVHTAIDTGIQHKAVIYRNR